ncbi:class II glutamine amidotransferase [Oceaniglobus ichthyenteri]|uniref:class II glutamine amidotransferase n=1 Tax=Oceaniglobus ichthyenteri TaxID=2136177 RepID=UPI000D38BFD0|nr:class II glutamine amidotransferase [Oceaniglobus ichthyenteri]
MCRIAAYQGPAIPLENIIVRPTHSLLTQSQHATEAKLAVNGDGFGIAWYQPETPLPGLYRDVLPAWADGNLTSLCRMVRSPQFIAHIRASTVGETSRQNCHPFTWKNWSFCHNGQVPHINAIRRRLEAALPDALYDHRQGTTDSELIFLTLLAHGLADDPARAIQAMIADLGAATHLGPIRLTCVFSDGDALYGFRHASDGRCPSLYLSDRLDNGGRAMASEPLEQCGQRWRPVHPDQLLELRGLQASYRDLAPVPA